ncbi:MAG: DUF3800 domain-containing protein [Protaetiibacter sp.]
MLFAYVDESGNTGEVSKKGSTPFYALGCVLLDADQWPDAFEKMIEFRRSIKSSFGVPVRAELKANYLIRNSGSLAGSPLAPAQRGLIYRYHLHTIAAIRARAFGIVIDKRPSDLSGQAVLELAWSTLLQRLERTTHYDQQRLMLIHDEGENDAVRKQYRKARRYLTAGSAFSGGSIRLAAPDFVEDPVPRSSASSYFIQLADLVAYASWRSVVPPSSSVARVVPQHMWMQLGSAIHRPVNSLAGGGVPGVVVRHR